ncbi:MAG: hypothetical protein ACLFP8_05965 [Alphaproteobacteria bacterium]
MNNYEERIKAIKERNQKVEADKAWETSWIRRISIALVTYLLAVIFMWSIDVPHPHFSAFVPTGGFVLSTLTLGLLKEIWIKKYKKHRTS